MFTCNCLRSMGLRYMATAVSKFTMFKKFTTTVHCPSIEHNTSPWRNKGQAFICN